MCFLRQCFKNEVKFLTLFKFIFIFHLKQIWRGQVAPACHRTMNVTHFSSIQIPVFNTMESVRLSIFQKLFHFQSTLDGDPPYQATAIHLEWPKYLHPSQ